MLVVDHWGKRSDKNNKSAFSMHGFTNHNNITKSKQKRIYYEKLGVFRDHRK